MMWMGIMSREERKERMENLRKRIEVTSKSMSDYLKSEQYYVDAKAGQELEAKRIAAQGEDWREIQVA